MKRVGVTVAQIEILDDDKIDVFVLYLTLLILVKSANDQPKWRECLV